MRVRAFLTRMQTILVAFIETISTIITIVVGLLLIVTTLSVLSFSITYIALQANRTPPTITREITDLLLQIFDPNISVSSPDVYISSLSLLINTLFFVITLLFAITPFLTIIQYRRDVKRRSSIKSFRVFVDERDDLEIMLEYYRGAQEVTVYAGDFSWVSRNLALQQEIIRLAQAGKIRLISYKEQAVVKNGIGNDQLFGILSSHFMYQSGKEAKCSYIKRQGNSFFLYKSESMVFGQIVKHVYVLTDSPETRYLLYTLEKFCH